MAVATLAVLGGVCAQDPPRGPLPPPPGYVLVGDLWLPGGDASYTANGWPAGAVPYLFDGAVTVTQENLFKKAMAEIEAVSGVDFVPRTSQADYVYIQHGPQANVSSSALGRIGGAQAVNVGSNHWDLKYILVHELFHALGFIHEQQRPDRDNYVTINWQNISQTGCNGSPCNGNFQIHTNATVVGAYDYESIMHYGQNAFSNGNGPTITCANPCLIGNLMYMTQLDAGGLRARYGPPPGPSITSLTPNSVNAGANETWVIVDGSGFFEGSPNANGVQGSVVTFNSVPLKTVYLDKDSLLGIIPASMLQTPSATNTVRVKNDVQAAGGYSNSVNFAINTPPCPTQSDRVGNGVAGLGDVDGDGYDDYVVGAPGYDGKGKIWCYSGRTSQVLWSRSGGTGYDYGHSVANGGDMDGDGVNDVLVGAPGYSNNRGRAYMVSGAMGAYGYGVSGSFTGEQFGWAVSTTGDITGDGVPDWVIGAPFGGGGRIKVVNGATGSQIYNITESQTGAALGYSVGGGHDVNGDGTPDFVAGTPNMDTNFVFAPSYTDRGRSRVYSGSNGSALSTKYGDGDYDYFGRSVALVPPLTGSGNAFTLVGATEVGNISGSSAGPGYVKAFRGHLQIGGYSTWQVWTGGTLGDNFGQAVAYAGDINDDGIPDIAIGANQGGTGIFGSTTGPGYVEIRAGRSGNLLYSRSGGTTSDRFGWSVARAGDTNGDAVAEVVVGAPFRDTPCLNAGGYTVVNPPVPPERHKLMITEVSTYEPDGLEITNFGTSSVSLLGWSVIWKEAGLFNPAIEVALPSVTLAPGEIAVVKEPAGSLPEVPSGTQVLTVLPPISTSLFSVAVGLRSPAGIVADEVVCASTAGVSPTLTTGGLFRGHARDVQSGPIIGPRNCERVWGLDSNSGGDWTSNGLRSFGLENTSSGYPGYDPLPPFHVRINELDVNPDYIELYTFFALDLQGWYFLCSANHGSAHAEITPWPDAYPVSADSFFVVGDTTTPPGELPSGVPYRGLNTVSGGNIPWGNEEMDCALYDRYGRLVDLVRTTGHDDDVAHNHPRAPSAWSDFTGAARKHDGGDRIIGRNGIQSDTDTASDWWQYTTRTMGSPNTPGPFYAIPSGETGLNVRLNATAAGGGLTIILNGGPEHAGELWSFTFTYGHLKGTGPVLGLGPQALTNYVALSTTSPFFGTLDSRGSARVDFPSGLIPPGVETDNIFVLQNAQGALLLLTPILEWDS